MLLKGLATCALLYVLGKKSIVIPYHKTFASYVNDHIETRAPLLVLSNNLCKNAMGK